MFLCGKEGDYCWTQRWNGVEEGRQRDAETTYVLEINKENLVRWEILEKDIPR